MRKTANLWCLSLLFIACAGFVFAQPGGGPGGPGGRGPGGRGPGGPGGPGGPMMAGPGMMMGGPGIGALFSEEGRKDIGLSDNQVSEIQNAFRDMRPREGQQFPGPNSSQADRENFRKEMEKRMGETIGKIEKVMTKEQLEKARARSFQAGGGFASAGMNPFAQAALGLTDDQKAKIRGFQEENMQKMRKFFEENRPSGPPDQMSQEDRQKMFERMRTFGEENQKEMESKIKGILTDEQKQKGEKMLGETPDYIKNAIEQGPRGPGGRGGRGGEGGGYRPGADSWRPGQGAPAGGGGGERRERRFPSANRNNNN